MIPNYERKVKKLNKKMTKEYASIINTNLMKGKTVMPKIPENKIKYLRGNCMNRIKQTKNLSLFGDYDKDEVMNILDCQPYNKKKQGVVHDFINAYKEKKEDDFELYGDKNREQIENYSQNTKKVLTQVVTPSVYKKTFAPQATSLKKQFLKDINNQTSQKRTGKKDKNTKKQDDVVPKSFLKETPVRQRPFIGLQKMSAIPGTKIQQGEGISRMSAFPKKENKKKSWLI